MRRDERCIANDDVGGGAAEEILPKRADDALPFRSDWPILLFIFRYFYLLVVEIVSVSYHTSSLAM